jgi:hypothetical protein
MKRNRFKPSLQRRSWDRGVGLEECPIPGHDQVAGLLRPFDIAPVCGHELPVLKDSNGVVSGTIERNSVMVRQAESSREPLT